MFRAKNVSLEYKRSLEEVLQQPKNATPLEALLLTTRPYIFTKNLWIQHYYNNKWDKSHKKGEKMTVQTDNQAMRTSVRGRSAKQDFVIVYPSAVEGELAEAVYALYYLPQNYKLVVLTDVANQAEVRRIAEDVALTDRVSFEGDQPVSDRMAPLSFADVILRGDDESFSSSVQRQISMAANHSPEALASAILRAARV
jgi:hypothetical protein